TDAPNFQSSSRRPSQARYAIVPAAAANEYLRMLNGSRRQRKYKPRKLLPTKTRRAQPRSTFSSSVPNSRSATQYASMVVRSEISSVVTGRRQKDELARCVINDQNATPA